jgi:hypothetical protein
MIVVSDQDKKIVSVEYDAKNKVIFDESNEGKPVQIKVIKKI